MGEAVFLPLRKSENNCYRKLGVYLQQKGVRSHRREARHEAHKKKIMIGALVVVLVVLAGVLGYYFYHRHQVLKLLSAEGIYQGVTVDGISLEGMTKEEALATLEEKYVTEVNGQVLTFQFDEETKWEVPFTDLGAGYHLEEAVEQAYNTGREGTDKERFQVGAQLLKEGIDIPLEYSYDTEKMNAKLTEIVEEFDRHAVDSTVSRKNGKFVVTPEETGRIMDQEKTEANAAAVLDTRMSGTAKIEAEVEEPKITAEANSHVTDLIGSFKTTYTMSDKNRNTNLEVGCNYINGTVLAPGETFSANVELGPQTYEGGYKDAAVYNNGKVEKDVAGGVCQVTTTLYNAVIDAELEIVERHPHSMTVGYVPLGRDAAVAGNYKDLKFKNNTEYPVLIEAYASGGNLVMNIYGHEVHSSSHRVEYETVYEETIPKPAEVVTEDPDMPEGERKVTSTGKTGAKVSVYKIVYENGKQVSREWFSSSSYRATADQVTVGTKKAEEKKEETTADTASTEQPGFGIQ